MRILVFEFVTGGGLIDQALPQSLLQEAYLMRNALIDDLLVIPNIELLVLHDKRTAMHQGNLQCLTLDQGMVLATYLQEIQSLYDAVWLIAPETEGILLQWCRFFNTQAKFLCTSSVVAVALCQDKLQTINCLSAAGIACVPTRAYVAPAQEQGHWVLKNNNSVGCDEVYLLRSAQDWHVILAQLKASNEYIIQPYIKGRAMSLSCLFYQGKAYFICCNEQHVQIEKQQFVLTACTVHVQAEQAQQYQQLCSSIAVAIPELFAYVGIDFIQTESGECLVLEINPRLTSSYAGIKSALGINIAAQVLRLANNEQPILTKSTEQSIRIDINNGTINAR